MVAVPADLSISSRWILPMTSPDALLEHHALVVRDGRIIDVLPRAFAAERYAATIELERPHHLLLPGLVNARAQIVPDVATARGGEHIGDFALLGIGAMLRAGISCFCAMGCFPQESARAAAAQGMRAVIGVPLAATPSPWAQQPDEYVTRALEFRDEWSGHPMLAAAFAPQSVGAISDAMFSRIATLANELDAGVLISLHESAADVADCVARHGLRPIERLHALGLLTPALTAANGVHVDAADLALAQRSGIALTLCPRANLRSGSGLPPLEAWARTGLRLSLGTAGAAPGASVDLWSELNLLALAAGSGPWELLAAATRGGAAALGLEADIGTLETGKWADLCCVDLASPAMVHAGGSAAHRLVFGGGRDIVSDLWVSGRHLLNGGAFTRLNFPELAARAAGWPSHALSQGKS
jgi:5-methylthioadenosine/S-adenosylhomocysteine deaminase